jgi:hypothetical protein
MRYATYLRFYNFNDGPNRDGTCVTCGATDAHTPNGFNCSKCKSSVSLEDKEKIEAKDKDEEDN